MKPILLIFVTALAAGCARPAYIAKSDAANAWMSGGIAQIRETVFDNPADTGVLPAVLGRFDTYTVTDYNRTGNITLTESFRGPDSVRIAKQEYLYDPSGERLERALTHDLGRRGVVTLLYDYDEGGRLTSEIESNGLYRFDYRHDRQGYPRAQITDLPETGKRVVIQRYSYDGEGRLKRLRGERDERYRYYPGGTIAEVRGGRRSLDRYNKQGDLEAMAVRIDRKDRRGRTFERFEVTLTAEYEYDARGNWIRRTMFYREQVQSVAVREIDYYNN